MARAVPTESQHDIIVSRATAPGDGAIAIVRMSGSGSAALAAKIFQPRGRIALSTFEPGHLILGFIHDVEDVNAVVDEGFLVQWHVPKSYTGEEMIEFQLHGSHAIVDKVIELCVRAGARLASPGEFTRRAYLNGKLDLAQAEAVCDLIRAQTEAASRAALAQLGGGLSREIARFRDMLVPVVAELEAHVDFPEEGLEYSTRERLGRIADTAVRGMQLMLDSARRGQHLREGARVVLAGPPNAGKSSLFNLLLRRERALVTPHAGTTRDTIEAQIDLGGYPVVLVDTAGLRARPEEIEALGIARTHEEIRAADLVLFLIDRQKPDEAGAEYARIREAPHFLIVNKIDLEKGDGEDARFVSPMIHQKLRLSTKTREGVDQLEQALIEYLGGSTSAEQSGMITNRRHAEAMRRALGALHTAAEGLASELSPEFIVVDLTEAIAALDVITGRQTLDEDVLDLIFSTFCLGK